MTKYLVGFVGIVLLALAIAGGYVYPKALSSFGSSAGTTFNTAKFAGAVVVPSAPGANATTTSILNNDTFTRYVTSWKAGCNNIGSSFTQITGTGLANWTISVATTSTAAPATFSAANSYAPIAANFTVPTSSVDTLISSSTLQTATSTKAVVWHSGEYMTFGFNATNTAACTVGVDYIGS